jgi:Protein of unknown function (DUF3263)
VDAPTATRAVAALASGLAVEAELVLDVRATPAAGQPPHAGATADAGAVTADAAGVAADAAAIVAAVDDLPTDLDDQQRAILDFERTWWKQAGAKEQAIRDTFAISPTRYYQRLNTLLELPGALSYDPGLVHRLQRLRSSALRSRRLS